MPPLAGLDVETSASPLGGSSNYSKIILAVFLESSSGSLLAGFKESQRLWVPYKNGSGSVVFWQGEKF